MSTVANRLAGNKPLADYLPTLTIKAKDFANELTSHNVVEKDLKGQANISTEHVENNKAVRKMLIERGVKPETLPPADDVKKLERKLEADEKKVAKTTKKITGKRNEQLNRCHEIDSKHLMHKDTPAWRA